MEQSPQLVLRDWTACDIATQRRVFTWPDHPSVPAHASQPMVAMAVARTRRLVTLNANCLDVRSWVVYDSDRPVAFLSAELLTKWPVPEVFFPAESDFTLAGPTMSFSTLVDPELWGHGYATAAKMAACGHPASERAATFHACIRADNERSLKAIAKVPGIALIGTAAEDGHPWQHFGWNH